MLRRPWCLSGIQLAPLGRPLPLPPSVTGRKPRALVGHHSPTVSFFDGRHRVDARSALPDLPTTVVVGEEEGGWMDGWMEG